MKSGRAKNKTTNLDLGEAGNRLDPAEDLLDAFAAALADGIAGMAQGAPINGGLAPFAGLGQMIVNGDVRHDLAFPQGLHETFDIECLIGTERDSSRAGALAIDESKGRPSAATCHPNQPQSL